MPILDEKTKGELRMIFESVVNDRLAPVISEINNLKGALATGHGRLGGIALSKEDYANEDVIRARLAEASLGEVVEALGQ